MNAILVTRCYEEVTPESAEDGDFSDTGVVYENEPFSFRDLVSEIRKGGFYREGSTEWLTTSHEVTCYRTLTSRAETLHFSRDNPERALKYFNLAVKAARR